MSGRSGNFYAIEPKVSRFPPDEGFGPGYSSALPTASRTYYGQFWHTETGTWVCQKDSGSGYEWVPLGYSGASGLDSRYVNVTGDTMTGLLTLGAGIPNLNAAAGYSEARVIRNSLSGVDHILYLGYTDDTAADTSVYIYSDTSRRAAFTATQTILDDTAGSGTRVVVATAGGVVSASNAPTFTDFTNANHDHGDADDGGTIPATSVTGGGWVLTGDSGDFATQTAVSVDNCFSATYDLYFIEIRLTARSVTTAELRRINMRTGGTNASGATDYAWQRLFDINTTFTGSQDAADPSMACGTANTSTTQELITIWLRSPFLAAITLMGSQFMAIGTNMIHGQHMGWHAQTVSYDGFRFFPDSGNVTGRIRVWGVRH